MWPFRRKWTPEYAERRLARAFVKQGRRLAEELEEMLEYRVDRGIPSWDYTLSGDTPKQTIAVAVKHLQGRGLVVKVEGRIGVSISVSVPVEPRDNAS